VHWVLDSLRIFHVGMAAFPTLLLIFSNSCPQKYF
jgi:hypothetical protein